MWQRNSSIPTLESTSLSTTEMVLFVMSDLMKSIDGLCSVIVGKEGHLSLQVMPLYIALCARDLYVIVANDELRSRGCVGG